MNDIKFTMRNAILGMAVAESAALPVAFVSRTRLKDCPVSDITGNGTFKQPAGTWSDATGMSLSLVDALSNGFCIHTIANNLVEWLYEGKWTPEGQVFDVGMSTRSAIRRIRFGASPDLCGNYDSASNGSASIKRILPLSVYLSDKPMPIRFEIVKKVSALTNGNLTSVIACFILTEFTREILKGIRPEFAYHNMQLKVRRFTGEDERLKPHAIPFNRILESNIAYMPEHTISSMPGAVNITEAAIWTVLNADQYKGTVLKAVNLGNECHSVSAIAGFIGGLLYGQTAIPENWMSKLKNKPLIDEAVLLYEQDGNRYTELPKAG